MLIYCWFLDVYEFVAVLYYGSFVTFCYQFSLVNGVMHIFSSVDGDLKLEHFLFFKLYASNYIVVS